MYSCFVLKKKLTKESFVEKAQKVHCDKYEYSKFILTRVKDKSIITCPLHGDFYMSAQKHLEGHGCPKCGIERRTKRQTCSLEIFKERSKEIHGSKYDYSNVVLNKNLHTKIKIVCPIHGEFEQYAYDHLKGHGCPKCAVEKAKLTFEDFLGKANIIHKGKYSYRQTILNGNKTKISITCPFHGEFEQDVESHLKGCGCPKCANSVSKNEQEIYEYCCGIVGKEKVKQRDRMVLNGRRELDIYVPSLKLAIEYNGILWHSEKYKKDKFYHLKKLEDCEKKGITLIQIFEDEYEYKKEIVLKKIKHMLTKQDFEEINNVHIQEISPKLTKKILEGYSLNGFVPSSVHIGLFHEKKLIGVGSFKKNKQQDNSWLITNIVCGEYYDQFGCKENIISFFIKNYHPSFVEVLIDRRWNGENEYKFYKKLDFEFEKFIAPSPKYVCTKFFGVKRFNRKEVSKFKKEGKIADEQIYKIWDCGSTQFVWKTMF